MNQFVKTGLARDALLHKIGLIAIIVALSGAGTSNEPVRIATAGNLNAIRHESVKVEMRDGVQLSTDLYFPDGQGPWPAVLRRMPYARDSAGKQFHAESLTKNGYVFVLQSQRSRFGSDGEWSAFQNAAEDGFDAVQWVARQPWCDGRIATNGGSAGGINQYLMARSAPPELDCQHVVAAACNLYSQVAYPGGRFHKALAESWVRQNRVDPSSLRIVREHPQYDDYWSRVNAEPFLSQLDLPVMHVAGWFDAFQAGNLRAFQLMNEGRGRGKQKLVIGPWSHGTLRRRQVGDLTFPENAAWSDRDFDQTRWFDYWLKGEQNGLMNEPPVRFYMMGDTDDENAPGNQWRTASQWPVPSTSTRMFLRENGRLTFSEPDPDEPPDSYLHDPRDPVPTIGGRSLGVGRQGPRDQRPLEERQDVLVYTSDILSQPLEIAGPVTARLWVISGADDMDFSVRLCDVYPDGRSMLMADGLCRAQHQLDSSQRGQFEPWKPVFVDVDLWSTSVAFNRGHRIRVIISSSDFPEYDVLRGSTTATENHRVFNLILHDQQQPSFIRLPVVSESP